MRTRDLLAVTLLTLIVVGTTTAVHLTRLAGLGLEEVHYRSETALREIAALAGVAVKAAPERDAAALLRSHAGLATLLDAVTAHAPDLVYARVEDREGRPLAAAPAEGEALRDAEPLEGLLEAGALRRVWTLLGEGRLLETELALELGERSFGRVRVGTDTSLLRARLERALLGSVGVGAAALGLSWAIALAVSGLTRRPLRRLGRQIERLRAGDYEVEGDAWDLDFAGVASQLGQLGKEIQSQRVQLLAEKRTLEEVLDHLQQGVLLTDEDDAILYYNRAVAGLVGRALSEALGAELDEVLSEAHPLVRAVRRAHREEGELDRLRVSLGSGDRFREALLSAVHVRRAGDAKAVLVLLEDLGGFRALQDLIEYSTRVTELGRMTAGVAHEVRNPLNAMHLNIELLRARFGGSDPELERTLNVLDDAVRSLNTMVEGLLDYLRPSPLKRGEVDPNALLRGLASFFEAEAHERGIDVELELADRKPVVEADEERLRQVLVNLIQNAFEAMERGGTLRLRTACEGALVRIDVEDTGEGIAPDQRERIFQLYYTTRQEGSGIGLSFVHRIVLEHGGSLHVDSEPGRGARFEIRLPARPGSAEPAGGPGEAA